MIVEVSVYLVSKRILKSHVQAAAKRRHLSVNESIRIPGSQTREVLTKVAICFRDIQPENNLLPSRNEPDVEGLSGSRRKVVGQGESSFFVPLSYLVGDAAAARTSPSEIAVSFLSAADSSSSVA